MTRHVKLQTDSAEAAQLRRSLWVGYLGVALISVVLVALLGRVAQLQHRPPAQLADQAGPRQTTNQLLSRRGALLDRKGRRLAVTHVGYRLFVDPQLIEDFSTFSFYLAQATGDDPARIDRLIAANTDRRYVVVKPLLDDALVQNVRQLNRRAVGLEPVSVRSYPQGPLAGQVIGFVGAEHRGLDGLEFSLNDRLAGQDGAVRFVRDSERRPVWVERDAYRPPTHGDDLRLSLDVAVQAIAERYLAETCGKHKAEAGEAIVMDAVNGQVLAMANWPAYDPSSGGKGDANLRRNRCVTDPYEPGSIFKPFVHSAATMMQIANPTEKIDCTDAGYWVSPAGRRLRDAHGVGEVTWDEVLVNSSNIGMAQVGLRMGKRKMHATLQRFGFGAPTGSRLPGESAGIVNPLRRWNHYSLTSVPMGQEVAVTPLQMVRAFAAFANGGLMPTPTLIADHEATPIYQRAIAPQAADHTRAVLRRVVAEGTGRRANSKRYRIWGKTGTAQVPDPVNGGFIEGGYTGSFVCGAPLRNPRIVVIVVVHQPKKSLGYYGGVVAAPYAQRIVEDTLQYLGVPEDGELDDTPPTRVAATH